jgi:hypothetical protein
MEFQQLKLHVKPNSQKTAIFIVTAVKTSNLTSLGFIDLSKKVNIAIV